jgi:hypothetical protein
MGKFITAKFNSNCKQTGNKIKKGDHIYYVSGRGSFHFESEIYKEHRQVNIIADHIQANEDAYFDDFCSENNI